VSIAEQAGFVKSLSRWVVRSVVRDLLTFSQAGLTFNIAINISADDVLDSTLLTYIESLLSEAGFGNERILLELTERVIVKNPDTAIASLNAFKNAGFKIAIDDFGTGYSSLSYLTKLPIDILKIDRSFVCDLTRDASLQAICNTIIKLASDLNMTVVAEGIEDQNSMEILRELGCQWGQGYFICKPLPINKLIVWMQKNPK
jgi:EAL domain-containing protein (putative c-di-GMP-specific phosphodiesterase class I)